MLLTLETLASYLGLESSQDLDPDTETPVLVRSARMSQTLVESYIGWQLEYVVPQDPADAVPLQHVENEKSGIRLVRLSPYPVRDVAVHVDGVQLPTDRYRVTEKMGVVRFEPALSFRTLEIEYAAGYAHESELPSDILEAMVNIALSIYNSGGTLASSVDTSNLKSLTMFDAMSMSFDTTVGADTASNSPARTLVSQWAFVLDKYRLDKYTMGV